MSSGAVWGAQPAPLELKHGLRGYTGIIMEVEHHLF